MGWTFSRARHVLRERGLGGALHETLRALRRELLRRRPAERRWIREHKRADAAFDRSQGVDTGGFIRLSALGPDHAHLPGDYIPISEDEFEPAVSSLSIRHEDFAFVDLGSGKGRALLLAARLPFREIVGVELAPELHRIAAENLRRCDAAKQQCSSIALHCMDAARYELPEGPLVLFLYNPFGAEVVRRVAQRAYASYLENPRDLRVLYVNPPHLEVWEQEGFVRVACGRNFDILRPAPALQG